jgi:hypothetical protein
MALGLVVAADIINAALTFYVKGKEFAQTIQEKPLLAYLKEHQEEFPSGKDNVSSPVQGAYMSDTPGFFQGYSEDDALSFAQAQNLLRVAYPWKEQAASLIITWTELKKDGINVHDHQKTSEHSKREMTVLTGLLDNRLRDFGESWARAKNNMYWLDGSQDAKQTPGIRSVLQDAGSGVAGQNIGGLSTTAYSWWNFRSRVGAAAVQADEAGQTLTKALRSDIIQLTRYGGKPDKAFMGSAFWDALMLEVQAKGTYTQEGFTKESSTDFGMATIRMRGLGTFTYDPTLDLMGRSKFCYIIDGRRIRRRPMAGEEDKMLTPERPYNYLVFLRTMTDTSALEATQLNSSQVVEVK